METRTKAFDCVQLQHKGGEKVHQATQGMTLEEELAFWTKGTEELLRLKKTAAKSALPEEPKKP